MKVSVIIPAWNLWELTLPCLESLARHTDQDVLEVLVVDNASTDATAEALSATLARLFGSAGKALRLPHNQGFAKACNAGAAAASGELLFFLNNDTLLTEGWLPPLCESLAKPGTGMVGPLLLFPNGLVQHCGIVFSPSLEMEHLYAHFPAHHPLVCQSRSLQALTGAALLLPAALFRRCGGFYEGYVNGFEDVDLCCAARREGLHLRTVPASVIVHLTSQTPGRFDHDHANATLLNTRWPGGCTPDVHRWGHADGYCPVLSPALDLYLTLPARKEASLTTAFADQWDEPRCRARLAAEPLWQGGYALLAQHEERFGQWTKACQAHWLAAHFFPLPGNFAALARCAARSGDTALAQEAGQKAAALLDRTTDSAALHKKADALARWGKNVGDTLLAEIFAAWSRAQ